MNNHPELQYLNLLQFILSCGEYKENRTGIGTYAVFGTQMRFDMNDGFPLFTTKLVHFPSIAHELLWFISGSTNIKYLQDNGVRIWNEWADENGELGPVYGYQWRKWEDWKIECYSDIAVGQAVEPAWMGYEWVGHISKDSRGLISDYGLYHRKIDQLQNVIDKLRTNPNDRRLIVTAWNPGVLPFDDLSFAENVAREKQALPPCHAFYQFFHINGKLSLHMYQRSVDSFLGLPFNIASYALLLHMVAQVTNLEPYELVWTGGDTHIYENHIEQISEQVQRSPLTLPRLELNPDCREIDDFKYEDISLVDYHHWPALKGKVAV